MFAVGFGSKNRETAIRRIAGKDHTTAVVLAAVHFEWMLKRAVLKLGISPTRRLRLQLEDVYKIREKGGKGDYQKIWRREVEPRFKNSALGSVLGNLPKIQSFGRKGTAMDVRGRIVHGNGTVSRRDAQMAVDQFLRAGEKLRAFAAKHGEDLDSVLRRRIKRRLSK